MIKLPFQIKNHNNVTFKSFDENKKTLNITLKGIDLDIGLRVKNTNDIMLNEEKDKQNITHIRKVYEIKGFFIRFV